jgi:hypothetical protein
LPPSTTFRPLLPGDRTTSQSQGPPDHCPSPVRPLEAEPLGSIGGWRVGVTMGRGSRLGMVRVAFHSRPLLDTALGTEWAKVGCTSCHVNQPCAVMQTLSCTWSTHPTLKLCSVSRTFPPPTSLSQSCLFLTHLPLSQRPPLLACGNRVWGGGEDQHRAGY